MANGYCPALLTHIEALTGCDPAKKLSPQGFLQMVLKNQDDSAVISAGYEGSHVRPLTVKYRERPLASTTLDTLPDCVTATTNPYKEFPLPGLINKSRSFWVPMSTLKQYCQDVSERIPLNGANFSSYSQNTTVMREVYDLLISEAGALLSSIDLALVTQMSTQFGVNTVTGTNAAVPLEFTMNSIGLNQALYRIITDMRENEFCDFGNVAFVGTGPFINMELFKTWWGDCCNAQGINVAQQMQSFQNMFFDKNARTVWGDTHVGVFEPGSVALLNAPRFSGNFTGKLGNSEYFTMNLPVDEFCCPQGFLDRLAIDVQIKEMDCAPSLAIDGAAAAAQGPGVMVMLSWTGSLFVRPDMYRTGDPLDGTNGTLRYDINEAPVVTP